MYQISFGENGVQMKKCYMTGVKTFDGGSAISASNAQKFSEPRNLGYISGRATGEDGRMRLFFAFFLVR